MGAGLGGNSEENDEHSAVAKGESTSIDPCSSIRKKYIRSSSCSSGVSKLPSTNGQQCKDLPVDKLGDLECTLHDWAIPRVVLSCAIISASIQYKDS